MLQRYYFITYFAQAYDNVFVFILLINFNILLKQFLLLSKFYIR